MAKRNGKPVKKARRTFTKELKQEAVQMLLDGHTISSVSKNLGIGNTNLLYRWKAELVTEGVEIRIRDGRVTTVSRDLLSLNSAC